MLVCFVSLMHVLWGTMVLLNGGTVPTAATRVFIELVPDYHTRALTYIIAGLLPTVLIWRPGSLIGLLFTAPQLILLVLSGISAVVSISLGMYADGTARSHYFIAVDQGIYIFLAVLYAFESLDRYHERP